MGEHKEMDMMYECMNEEFNVEFENRKGETVQNATAYRQSIDKVNPIYHPLLFYLIFILLKLVASVILRMSGFQFYRTSSGSGYWYRPAVLGNNTVEPPPILFYHGISPGGLFIYLPMILCGLSRDGQAMFCFENPSITCTSLFLSSRNVLTEEDTVQGTIEAMDRHLGINKKVCLCGHSMGTCQLTWLLHHDGGALVRDRVSQVVLLDPV